MRVFQYVQFIIVSLVRISVQIQNNIADFFPPPPPVKIVPYRKQRSDEHDPCKHRDIPNIKRHVIFVFNYKYCHRDETSPADKIVDRYRLNDDVRLIIDLSSRDSTSNSSNLSSTISPRRRPCPWLFATVSGFIGTHNFGQDSGHSW